MKTSNMQSKIIRQWTGEECGIRKVYKFNNGYGASVVKHVFSYGYKQGLWELAVVVMDANNDFSLTYATPITGDVIGWLNEDQVNEYLSKINELPVYNG